MSDDESSPAPETPAARTVPPRLDATSPDFDPLEALRSSETVVPVPGVRVFDNLKAYEAYLRRGGSAFDVAEEREEAARVAAARAERDRRANVKRGAKSDSKEVKIAVPASGRGAREFRNVLTMMEKLERAGGPLSRLAHYMNAGARIKVRTRNFAEIRGECTGFLELFDRFWNLILRDVDEVYQRLVTSTDELYDLDGAVAVVDPRYQMPADEGAETRKDDDPADDTQRRTRTPALDKRKPEPDRRRSDISRSRHEPSRGLYADFVEEMGNLNLSGRKPPSSSGKKSMDPLPEGVPPAILAFKKINGNRGKRVVFKRHIPVLMIRGENIVTISYAARSTP